MKKSTAVLLLLPLFAIACGSSPTTADTDEKSTAQITQALGDNGEPSQDDTSLETEDPEVLALTVADAGAPPAAPEAPAPEAPAPVDEGTDPQEEPAAEEPAAEEPASEEAVEEVVEEPAAEEPASEEAAEEEPAAEEPVFECTQDDVRRAAAPNDHLVETCLQNEWTVCLSTSCPYSPFWGANGPVPMAEYMGL
jgi:hypothetical protein